MTISRHRLTTTISRSDLPLPLSHSLAGPPPPPDQWHMTAILSLVTSSTANARATSRAWLNAFLAASDDAEKPTLYRTLSVEFFEKGVQFIGCDGTMLFRTWVAGDALAPMPEIEEAPERAIVVMDADKFASTFMRTLGTALPDDSFETIALAIEKAPADEMPLGEEFGAEILTLRALGQQLHCRLYDSAYPDWRKLQFGLAAAEMVDGMTLATRLFATVGKLKGVTAIACDFLGTKRQIVFHGTGDAEVRGLLMPMRRVHKTGTASKANDEAFDG